MEKETREGCIQVTGGRIWYRISGAGLPAAPLMALHGGPGASHYYLEPIEVLAGERPVILYDQLGCGNSERPADRSLWTIGHFTEEIDAIRRELGLKRLHILGQSWGTMLAVDYMLTRKPEGVESIILSSPCLSASRWQSDCRRFISEMSEEDRKAIFDGETSGDFSSARYKNAVESFYKKHLCRIYPWPDCIAKTFENMGTDVYEYMWGPSEFTMTGTLKGYERAERLKDIKAPLLFTCGRYDESSPESTEYFHRMAPGSEFVVFEDASHMHHVEKTEAYLDTVRSFLDR